MDNFVYGLTKKQTSPTSPLGYKSKTDPAGAIDQPINPMKQLIAAGATFVARSHANQVNHMCEMYERAIKHQGFSVVETLSECIMFYPGAFDDGYPRKGGVFETIAEKKHDNTPEDEARHDVTDEAAAYKIAGLQYPGKFGVFYDVDRPTKNALEYKWIESTRAKMNGMTGKDVAVGIRPEALGKEGDTSLEVVVELVEMLGSELLVHASIDAANVRQADDGVQIVDDAQATIIASLDPRHPVRVADRISLLVDTTRIHLFDLATGDSIGAAY